MSLLDKIVRRRPADLLLAAEAWLLLAWFRASLAFVPVRKIIGSVTRRSTGERAARSAGADVVEIARRVQWAVSAATRHSAMEFVCFPQALAGYTMLRRRGVGGTIVYGVSRSAAGELMAHTWLTVGDRTVLGGEAAPEFTAVERWT